MAAVLDIAKIEDRIDRAAAGAVAVADDLGGVRFQNMLEVMEFAKLMAVSDKAVPPHLRGNVGTCLAVAIQAMEWHMSPFSVANKSYVVSDRIAYEAQLIHAVIEQRAPIKGRLRHRYEGEGDNRVCIVSGTPKGETEALEWCSPPIGKITPKNSPLWKTKPDLQLYYNTSRDWCRVYFPDVILGIYARDELDDDRGEAVKDVTPKPRLADRLKGGAGQSGFSTAHVHAQIGEVIEDAEVEEPQGSPQAPESPEPVNDTPELADAAQQPSMLPETAGVTDDERATLRSYAEHLQASLPAAKKMADLAAAGRAFWKDRPRPADDTPAGEMLQQVYALVGRQFDGTVDASAVADILDGILS